MSKRWSAMKHFVMWLSMPLFSFALLGCSVTSVPVGGGHDSLGNGTSGNSSGSLGNEIRRENLTVNGCDPTHSVYGPFCISTVPLWTQSSAGLTEWSQIEAGATVEVKGATTVNAKTGKPNYGAVTITGPGGFKQMLRVSSNGGFDKKITFPREGTYQMGVGNDIKGQPGLSFQVYYVPHPEASTTLIKMFPNSRRKLPHDIVLVFPYGTSPSVSVEFTNTDGDPESGVTLQGSPPWTKITTNAKGVAMVPLSLGEPSLGVNRIYGALFSLSYLTGRVSNGVVSVWPKEIQTRRQKSAPPKVAVRGITYYETRSALALLDPVAFTSAFPGDELNRYDPMNGALVIQPNSTGRQVTVTPAGVVKISASIVAHVHPIVRNGELYLNVHDLVILLNTFAWASLTPNGTLRVADFLYP